MAGMEVLAIPFGTALYIKPSLLREGERWLAWRF